MQYYHNLATEKSWKELQRLKRTIEFVLIGGWAAYLYTKELKSKDIDIIVDFDVLSQLKEKYPLNKNDGLKKYEARKGEVQIDIYLPHYSSLGVPVEDLISETENIEGFKVIKREYLFVLKLYALAQRGYSVKGRKDFIDAIALFRRDTVEVKRVRQIVQKYGLNSELTSFKDYLDNYYELEELELNKHKFAKIKRKIKKAL